METNRTCPQCQQPLSADAPDGLCPQCLMAAASGPPPSAAGDGLPGDIIDIGDPAEVAKKLPQFEIIELLGRGGMGVVYKARQLQLDRIVAVKILPPVDALSPDFVARFTREARALAKLNHPNIVNVHDFGETGGLYYIIMEYVDGANLRQLLEARKLTPAEALAIVPKICDALEYAHEEGLVHRDIKPENLLIDKKGRVKIADFGLAKLLRREPLDMTLTLSGTALGTLRYMAPEQMDKPETVDHRADLYSLGVVIYEMLTGETPVGRFELPSQKAGVDVRLDKIVLHALEREPAQRYQHASEVRTDVENVTTNAAPVPAREPIGNSGGVMAIPAAEPGTPAVSARLSRTAILGAIWAGIGPPAGFLAFAGFTMHWRVQIVAGAVQAEHLPMWTLLITIPLALIAATAPFGTTILGGVGIRQIKRSGGRQYGLPLAAADVLFFPLLVLGLAVFSVLFFAFRAVTIDWVWIPGTEEHPPGSAFAHFWDLFILLDVLVSLTVCFFAGRAAWRAIAGVKSEPGPKYESAPPAGTKPQRRHLLTTFLALLSLSAFFFGANFSSKMEMTPAGRTSITTVGSFDPLFVNESGPSGFHSGFQIFSWSLFAIIVAGVSFAALLRVCREDEGKVARDPEWWRDWWKQVGIWCGLLFLACAIRTARNPQAVWQPIGAKPVPVEVGLPVPNAPVPPLGKITDGFGAEFTVPAGQAATFEIVTRKDGATVPIPNLAAYVLAPADQPFKGTFRWSREPLDFSTGTRRQPCRIEVQTPGGKASSGGLDLPETLEAAVGAMNLGLGLEPNREDIHWAGADTGSLPADGLVGLRVRTVAHGFKAGTPGGGGASGVATADWKKAQAEGRP